MLASLTYFTESDCRKRASNASNQHQLFLPGHRKNGSFIFVIQSKDRFPLVDVPYHDLSACRSSCEILPVRAELQAIEGSQLRDLESRAFFFICDVVDLSAEAHLEKITAAPSVAARASSVFDSDYIMNASASRMRLAPAFDVNTLHAYNFDGCTCATGNSTFWGQGFKSLARGTGHADPRVSYRRSRPRQWTCRWSPADPSNFVYEEKREHFVSTPSVLVWFIWNDNIIRDRDKGKEYVHY